MTIDDLDTFARCGIDQCGYYVWPAVEQPRCVAHGGQPQCQYAVSEWGDMLFTMPDKPAETQEVPQ